MTTVLENLLLKQINDVTTPLYPVRRISDSIVSVQHVIGHPVAKKSLSVSSGGCGGNGFQTESTSVITKPLIMKVLPLYLCMDDGKVYADQQGLIQGGEVDGMASHPPWSPVYTTLTHCTVQ